MLNPKNFLACGGLFVSTEWYCIHHVSCQLVLRRRIERFPNGRVAFLYPLDIRIRALADRYCFANDRDAFLQPSKHRGPGIRESRMILRIVETPSCNRKNVRVRDGDHEGYKYVLSMVETPSYTRENTSNRPYTVQMYLQTTRTLQNSTFVVPLL